MTIIKEIFRSSLMRSELSFRAIMPENCAKSRVNIPVLYLLHGLFGNCDNWLELSGLNDYLADKNFAVILPDGGDKWYSDSATNEHEKFETVFVREFIPFAEAAFQTGGSREKRAIAGLSMGGYGALKFGIKRPDLFIFAGSMSGAFNAPRLTETTAGVRGSELLPTVLKAFGDRHSAARNENDLFEIIRRLPQGNIADLPYLHLDCGINDDFLPVNRELTGCLREKQIAFTYKENSGGHDWKYWDQQIQVILKIVDKIFKL